MKTRPNQVQSCCVCARRSLWKRKSEIRDMELLDLVPLSAICHDPMTVVVSSFGRCTWCFVVVQVTRSEFQRGFRTRVSRSSSVLNREKHEAAAR